MDEFQRQLKRNQQSAINEFNTKPEFDKVRIIYKNNFDKIVLFIAKSNPHLAIEDIASLDNKSAQVMFDNMLLFQEINRANCSTKINFKRHQIKTNSYLELCKKRKAFQNGFLRNRNLPKLFVCCTSFRFAMLRGTSKRFKVLQEKIKKSDNCWFTILGSN